MLKNLARCLILCALAVPFLMVSGCSDEPVAPPRAAAPSGATSAPPLALLRLGPSGDLPRLSQIAARFDQPMVPLGAYYQVPEGALALTPDIPGHQVWLNQYTLVFVPDQPLTGSHHIKV
ncbi:MAG: hypothetical protein LBC90_02970, partial [Candidatus Adiutrix sp.]|nr:hypothetical protein [Candidatus Adiutrix sp.]